jgi:hypothetical protein
MTPDDRKSAVDHEAAAPEHAGAVRARSGGSLSGASTFGDIDGIRTPWRWAVGAIVLLAAAAEVAWFFGRAGGSEAERRQKIEAMSPAEQGALAAKFERFKKLDEPEQNRLRKLHEAIESEADPEALRTTLARYETWNSQLPPQVSAQLVGLPADRRATQVASIVAQRREAAAKVFSDADSKVLVAWLEKQVRGHQDEMMTQLPDIMRERLDHMGARERTWALMFFALSQRGPGASPLSRLSPVAMAELRGELSAAAQLQWDAAARNPDDLKQLLSGWVRQSMERHMAHSGPSTRITDDQLMAFFDRELSEEDRNRFVALPREEMMSQLRREYYRRKGLWREGYYWRGDRRPGEGMPGGPGGPGEAGAGDGRPGDARPGEGRGDGRPGMGGPRPFGQRPGGFGPGPRPGGGFGPSSGNPGGANPGGIPGSNPPAPPPNDRAPGGNAPPPPKPQA